MIKIIDGNLLDSNADIICHQVNCQGKMNSGIAKQIRERYPNVFVHYKKLCNFHCNKTELLGQCQAVEIDNGKYIANLFGQLAYGYDGKQYTDLNALENSMYKLRNMYMLGTNKVIAFPYGLGSVRGGANWDDVYAIIEDVFKDCNVEIWRLDKG